MFVSHVVRALPEAYAHIVQQLMAMGNGRSDYSSYATVKGRLLAAIQQDPKLPGAVPSGVADGQSKHTALVNSTTTLGPKGGTHGRGECVLFQKGNCRHGANCRYDHTTTSSAGVDAKMPRPKCYGCNSKGHIIRDCPLLKELKEFKGSKRGAMQGQGGRGGMQGGRGGTGRGRVYLTEDAEQDLNLDRAYTLTLFAPFTGPLFCLHSAELVGDFQDSFIMDSGATLTVVGFPNLLSKAVRIREGQSKRVQVGGEHILESSRIATFETADNLVFDANVILGFGQNILVVQHLLPVVRGGEVLITGSVMTVFDNTKEVVFKAFLCSDGLFRWWPKWKVACKPLAPQGTSLRAAQELVHLNVAKIKQEKEDLTTAKAFQAAEYDRHCWEGEENFVGVVGASKGSDVLDTFSFKVSKEEGPAPMEEKSEQRVLFINDDLESSETEDEVPKRVEARVQFDPMVANVSTEGIQGRQWLHDELASIDGTEDEIASSEQWKKPWRGRTGSRKCKLVAEGDSDDEGKHGKEEVLAAEEVKQAKKQVRSFIDNEDQTVLNPPSVTKKPKSKQANKQKEDNIALKQFAALTAKERKQYKKLNTSLGEDAVSGFVPVPDENNCSVFPTEEERSDDDSLRKDFNHGDYYYVALLSQEQKQRNPEMVEKFRRATELEVSQLAKHGVFSKTVINFSDLPPNTKLLRIQKLEDVKRDGRAKARVIVLGNTTTAGEHYNDTFAFLPTPTSIRSLFALATHFNWEMVGGDVHTAFLGTELDVELYVSMPKELSDSYRRAVCLKDNVESECIEDEEDKEPSGKSRIHKMLKAVPGLPQSGRLFQLKVGRRLTRYGMHPLPSDGAVYKLGDKQLFLVAWVDDWFILCPKELLQEAEKLWKFLQQEFDLPEWEEVSDCLGSEIRRDRFLRKLSWHMPSHLANILQAADMEESKPMPTPAVSAFRFTKDDCPGTEEEKKDIQELQVLYRMLVGKLGYLATWGRPDLAFIRSCLGRFVANPGKQHMKALKRVLRYLRGTLNKGIVYQKAAKGGALRVEGFFDASFADDVDNRKTTMGYVFFLAGGPISWESRLHKAVATSTNHAEFMAGARAAKEAIFIKNLLTDLGFPELVSPVNLFSDSAGAIALAQNAGVRTKNKHMETQYFYFREQVEKGNIRVTHVSGKDNIADVFTKALGPLEFAKHVSKLLGEVDAEFGNEKSVAKSFLARDFSSASDLMLWHHRLGHRNFADVASWLGLKMPAKTPFCRVCVEAKAARHPLGQRDVPLLTADRPAQVLCADIAGPFPLPSLGGARYFLVVVDVHTRRLFTSMLTTTGEFFDTFRDMVLHMEAYLGKERVVARLHTDGASYFSSNRLAEFCRMRGIMQTSSAPYTQALNGMAERAIRTLVEMVRAMLLQSKAPKRLFGEALKYAAFIINALPTRDQKGQSRLDVWYGVQTDRHLRIRPFGCAAWDLDVRPQKDKLDSKGSLCILVGYEDLSHCYRLATLPRFTIVRSAHVTFNEDLFPCLELQSAMPHPDVQGATIARGSATSMQDLEDFETRRSSRGWQPSEAALNNIANR